MGKGSDTSQTSAVISHASSRIQLEPSATCHSHHNRRGVKDKRVIYPNHLTSHPVRNRVHTHWSFLPYDDIPHLPISLHVISFKPSVSHAKKTSFLHSLKIENATTKKMPNPCGGCFGKAYQTVPCSRCGGTGSTRDSKGKEVNCTLCNGTGNETIIDCQYCHGTGVR